MSRNIKKKYTLALICVVAWTCMLLSQDSFAQQRDNNDDSRDTTIYKPSKRPTFQPRDRYGDPFSNTTTSSPLFLKDPNKLKLDVDIDTALNYTIYEKIGDLNYRPTTTMTFEEFKQYQDRKQLKEYWQTRSKEADGESAVTGKGFTPKIFVSPVLDRIFGGSYVEIVPRGFVTLDFGGQFQKINNPNIPIRQQRNGGFEFDQQINMSVVGKVGEKLAVTANFDNNNSFDFQNNMKVEYTGFKEDILQKLEIGNVSLPLNNTLIQGAQNLFGVKAQMQFGKLNVTTIASTQRGKVSSIDIPGGNNGQGRPFEIVGSNYDDNRHFFLGHFFRENYRSWIRGLPQITSGINITRVEVYVVNRNNDTQTLRNVIGLVDLGEPTTLLNSGIKRNVTDKANSNKANALEDLLKSSNRDIDNIEAMLPAGMESGVDYEKITSARKLTSTEYTYHAQLGYISLTRKLQNDEALAVAYEYTYNGRTYQVGELTDDYGDLEAEDAIYLKLLRQRSLSTVLRTPAWDLMMKNIYNLNVNQLSRENFQLRIIYRDDRTGIDNPQLQVSNPFIREKQLVEIFGLDKLNPVNDRQRDGNFDFVEGITVNTETGLIIFPYLEPFSEAIREQYELYGGTGEDASEQIKRYAYDELYSSTKADAELQATKNKYFLVGQYNAGSAREILIPGFGVSQGSVKIFAGGIPLIEGQDYSVDYTFGKVTILNESILSSGKNISVQYEQSDPFAFQTRSLLGTRFDYKLSDEVNFGSTLLYYNERPLISRNQIGTEPARNVQYGLDFNINKNSRLLTKLVDALPLIQTKEQSSFNITGEFAQLIPGTSNIIDGEGTAYIDDFENSATPYSLMSPQSWKLAATPSKDLRFQGNTADERNSGFKRAKLAWYQIDPQVYRNNARFRPENITDEDLQNSYVRYVLPNEIFPYYPPQQGNLYQNLLDIAYYPRERGPYNYNPQFNSQRPEDNWAGITSAIRTEVDFDKANIEYIEFWVMNPFGDEVVTSGKEGQPNTSGGKLIFHLGNISEDVIPDGRHAFENGLPPNGNPASSELATANEWGYVTTQTYLNNAFDNSPSARANQDVGLDGASDELERQLFLNAFPADVQEQLADDPSSDNFRFFLDESYDAANAQLLERYKDYNGLDGNSPVITNDVIARSGSQLPDNEDLNADNTLSELEEYYEYTVDLQPDLDIGKGYIVDKVVVDPENGPQITWFQFRIPIRGNGIKKGNIEGYKSIRYMRTILTGFKEPVVLRMANFRMVASRWRKYQRDLRTGFNEAKEINDDFTISVVNLEENGAYEAGSDRSNYVIPPGVTRDRDNTSSIPRQLNEQSIQICVNDLADGDARAIYKIAAADLFNYGRVKMYLHANSEDLNADLRAFLRLGTDENQNYYEIEIPLTISDPSIDGHTNPEAVWPSENQIDVDLNWLLAMKLRRDNDATASIASVYTFGETPGGHTLRILGRPDLSSVQVMMIGVRNPRSDDSRALDACVWANELRVTDFNRTAGWAVSTSMNAKLADFATVNGALRYTTFGFGSVSSKIGERTRDETTAYDVSANVNVDRLLPGNTGIKIPMFVGYGSTIINPQYDPANPDTRVEAALQSYTNSEDRQNFIDLIQDRTTERSFNLVNVRKEKVKQDAAAHIYDIENLAFSYSYSERTQTNFFTVENLQRQYKAGVAYNYAPKETGIEPFKNSERLKSPYLKFIKDFNLSLLPNNISVRGDLDRSFSKQIYRNQVGSGEFDESDPNYIKYFTFTRSYNMRWALSKGLTFEYTAQANSIIDEPIGEINSEEKRDSIEHNLRNFGRLKNFDQNVTVNYTVPFDKFPLTDWIGAEYRYQAGYRWQAGPLNIFKDEDFDRIKNTLSIEELAKIEDLPDSLDFKHNIQNNRENSISGKLDLVKLYNKVKFFKDVNTPPKPKLPVRQTPVRPGTSSRQTTQEADTVKQPSKFVKGVARLLMSVRSISATYSLNEGTTIRGFNRTPKFFGLDGESKAPGVNFILGGQDPNIRYDLARADQLVRLRTLTDPFIQTKDENISIRANVEPSTEFKIQLDVKKETSNAYQEIFRYDPDVTEGLLPYSSLNPSRSGAFKISYMSISTAFKSSNDDIESSVFNQFERNLHEIKGRFDEKGLRSDTFDSTEQDVIIPAFIAAYSGKSAGSISLSPFPSTPLPNWRVDYTGLGKLGGLKDVFQSVTISHAYQSSYAVMGYNNAIEIGDPGNVGINRNVENYNEDYFGREFEDEYVPLYVISQVVMSEQFSPLIGINVRTKNKLTARAEYKTKRDIALMVSNAQVTELNNKDVSFELGYTKNNLRLPFKSQGRTIVLKNDVTFRLNFSVTNGKTIQRRIDGENVVTNGNINYQLKPNVSYVVNQKLTIQGYFERSINEPVVSTSYRRASTRFGIQVRFSLAQ